MNGNLPRIPSLHRSNSVAVLSHPKFLRESSPLLSRLSDGDGASSVSCSLALGFMNWPLLLFLYEVAVTFVRLVICRASARGSKGLLLTKL